MHRQIIFAVVGGCIALFNGEGALGQARQASRRPIQTMPAGEMLQRIPPAPVTREPSWRYVEQLFDAIRKRRRDWGENFLTLSNDYAHLATPESTGSKSMEEHLKHLEKWRTEIPDSATARVVAAKALTQFAWEARGGGPAAVVTEQGWKLFAERIAEAHRLLDEAIALGVKDGEAYARLMQIGYAQSQPREDVDKWLAAGMKLDPTYFTMYTEMSTYLLPRWSGEEGDIEQFASEVARKLPGENGLEAFAWIAFSVQQYESGWGETLCRGEYDYETLVKGAEVMLKRHRNLPRVAHFAALCATMAQDHAAARRIRPLVGEFKREDNIWVWENGLLTFRNWSGAAENPEGEENWVFAGLTGNPGIAFGNERRHVWVAQQFGQSAVNLMNVRTGGIELALPSPGGVVNGFAYDPGRSWVLYSAWTGPFTGWMLWDLSGRLPPIEHATTEKCSALAMHPRRPIVYWAEGQKVHSWDVEADAAGPIIETKEHAHHLKFSADGSLLAVNQRVFDAASGKLNYSLAPNAGERPTGVHVLTIDAIDDEGRAWVIGKTSLTKDAKACLVRFSADGKTFETLLDDLGWVRGRLSPDRKLLATVGNRENGAAVSRIDVWNIAARKRVKQFDGHWNSIAELAFSPDSSKLASIAVFADKVKIWPLDGLAD
jgi:hypothetical protein